MAAPLQAQTQPCLDAAGEQAVRCFHHWGCSEVTRCCQWSTKARRAQRSWSETWSAERNWRTSPSPASPKTSLLSCLQHFQAKGQGLPFELDSWFLKVPFIRSPVLPAFQGYAGGTVQPPPSLVSSSLDVSQDTASKQPGFSRRAQGRDRTQETATFSLRETPNPRSIRAGSFPRGNPNTIAT